MSPWVSLARLPLLLAPGGLLACGDDLGPRAPAAIVITPEAPRVLVGQTAQLRTTVVDASGREIPGLDVDFESQYYTIISVSETGLLTSVASVGTSIITARHGDLSAQVEAEAVLPPSVVYVLPASLELDTEEGARLSAWVSDENGELLWPSPVEFRSDDPSVATVDAEGYVTAVSPGTATISVTSGVLEAEVPVTAMQVPTRGAITPLSVVLSSGGVQQLTAAVLDRTGDEIPGTSFTWSSSDETVVTVDETGQVRSVGPERSAIVTATSGGFSVSRGVFVGTPPDPQHLARVPLDKTYGVAWSPDGDRYFATSWSFGLLSGTIADFGFPDQVPIAGNYVLDVAINTEGSLAYVSSTNVEGHEGIAVVDLATMAATDFFPVGQGAPKTVGISGDGATLVVGTDAGVEVRDVASKRARCQSAINNVDKLTRHPTRPVFYATVISRGVYEIDPGSCAVSRTFPGNVQAHAVTPDGTRLFAVASDGVIRVWNLDMGAEEQSLASVSGSDLAVTPDGKFLYVVAFDSGDPELSIVDGRSGALVRTMELGGLARRVAMSRDGIAAVSNVDRGAAGWIDFLR